MPKETLCAGGLACYSLRVAEVRHTGAIQATTWRGRDTFRTLIIGLHKPPAPPSFTHDIGLRVLPSDLARYTTNGQDTGFHNPLNGVFGPNTLFALLHGLQLHKLVHRGNLGLLHSLRTTLPSPDQARCTTPTNEALSGPPLIYACPGRFARYTAYGRGTLRTHASVVSSIL